MKPRLSILNTIFWKIFLTTFFVDVSSSLTCSKTLSIGDNQFCYSDEFKSEETTWAIANDTCKKIGGTLPMPETIEEDIALGGLMDKNLLSHIYLDLQMRKGTWRWMNGDEVDYQGCYPVANFSFFADVTIRLTNNGKVECQNFCYAKNYSYFALFNQSECGCSNNFGEIEVQERAQCNLNCPSPNHDQTCGGEEAMNVWAVNGSESNWNPGQPNNDTESQSCAIVSNTGKWEDVQCAYMNAIICQIETSTERDCDQMKSLGCSRVSSSSAAGAKCLCLVDSLFNNYVARQKCSQLGGDIVQIDSRATSTRVTDLLNASANANSHFWIGLKKWDWIRMDGHVLQYTNWAVGEPKDMSARCALLDKGDKTPSWKTTDCSSLQSPICQKVTKILKSPSTPSTTRIFVPRTSTIPTDISEPNGMPEDQQNRTFLSKDTIGAIVGGACGFLIILVIVAIVIACCCYKRRATKNKCKRNSSQPLTTDQINLEDQTGFETVNKPTYFFGIGTVNKPVEDPDRVVVVVKDDNPVVKETRLVTVAKETQRVAKEDVTVSSKSLFDIDWSNGGKNNDGSVVGNMAGNVGNNEGNNRGNRNIITDGESINGNTALGLL